MEFQSWRKSKHKEDMFYYCLRVPACVDVCLRVNVMSLNGRNFH